MVVLSQNHKENYYIVVKKNSSLALAQALRKPCAKLVLIVDEFSSFLSLRASTNSLRAPLRASDRSFKILPIFHSRLPSSEFYHYFLSLLLHLFLSGLDLVWTPFVCKLSARSLSRPCAKPCAPLRAPLRVLARIGLAPTVCLSGPCLSGT